MIVFGPGYAAGHIVAPLEAVGWHVTRIGRAEMGDRPRVLAEIAAATHILCSVPPDAVGDPVLAAYGAALGEAPARWIGYLSSTGVYGDTAGAWVDETAPVAGRRSTRNAADLAWGALHHEARVFRLPGIYGPGRSALGRVAAGQAHRVAIDGQVFSRVHVADIAGAVRRSFDHGPPGVYNIADDLPAPQNAVIEAACAILGKPPPPLLGLDEAGLSPAARAFYAENRRVANGRARRLLHWRPSFPDFHAGLRAIASAN